MQKYHITERDKGIVEMRLDMEMTLHEIGIVVGLTRERVGQILHRIERIAEVKFPRRVK